MSKDYVHICGNPSFDMFTCLACHPEMAPKEPPVRRDPFEEGVACVEMSGNVGEEWSYWVSLHLNKTEFEEFKNWGQRRHELGQCLENKLSQV